MSGLDLSDVLIPAGLVILALGSYLIAPPLVLVLLGAVLAAIGFRRL